MIMNPFSVQSGTPGIPTAGQQAPVAGLLQRFQAWKKGMSVADITKGALKPGQRALTLAQPWKIAKPWKITKGTMSTVKGTVSMATKPVSAARNLVKSLKFW